MVEYIQTHIHTHTVHNAVHVTSYIHTYIHSRHTCNFVMELRSFSVVRGTSPSLTPNLRTNGSIAGKFSLSVRMYISMEQIEGYRRVDAYRLCTNISANSLNHRLAPRIVYTKNLHPRKMFKGLFTAPVTDVQKVSDIYLCCKYDNSKKSDTVFPKLLITIIIDTSPNRTLIKIPSTS